MLLRNMPTLAVALKFGNSSGCAQEVPVLLGVPSSTLNGSAAWIIMTGTTLSLHGYNSLIAKIVPLTAASRSADLIPYMLVRAMRSGFRLGFRVSVQTQLPIWQVFLAAPHGWSWPRLMAAHPKQHTCLHAGAASCHCLHVLTSNFANA